MSRYSKPWNTHALATLVLVAAAPAAAQATDDGKAAYQSTCGGCHSVDTNRIGPLHRGVVGRKPGGVPGYAYSPALKKLTGVWTPAASRPMVAKPNEIRAEYEDVSFSSRCRTEEKDHCVSSVGFNTRAEALRIGLQ